MNFVQPLRQDLTQTKNDIVYTVNYFKAPTKLTGVTDETYPDYLDGTTFGAGDYCIVPELKKIYRSTKASNTGAYPPSNPDKWTDYGSINSFNMLSTDENIGKQTSGTDSIMEFDFSRQTTFAFISTAFESFSALLIDTLNINYLSDYAGGTEYSINDAVIEDEKLYISLVDTNTGNLPSTSPMQWEENTSRIYYSDEIFGSDFGVSNFPDYLFSDFTIKTRVIIDDLRILPQAILRLKFMGNWKVGSSLYGRSESLGCTLKGSYINYRSSSQFETNTFTGFKTILRYGSVRVLNCDVIFDTNQFNTTSVNIEKLIDKTVLWIPTSQDLFSESISIGSIEDITLPMELNEKTKTTAKIIGVNR